jgi:hypothetical protein
MKHQIKHNGELVATIETHGDAVVVVHEPKWEIKPVQFAANRDTHVECTPEQRAEIIRIAREYGRGVYGSTEKGVGSDVYINLFWNYNHNYVCATCATPEDDQSFNWVPFDEFVARLKAEWVEEKREPANPDYSHLIGKWVRYQLEGYEQDSFFSKWGKIESVRFLDHDMIDGSITVKAGLQFTLHENPYFNHYKEYHESCFDLSDPRDTNPDEEERVISFDIERWRRGDFIRVQTRDGIEVMQLTGFECCDSFPLRGVYDGALGSWKKDGAYGLAERNKSRHDLMLVVKGGGE